MYIRLTHVRKFYPGMTTEPGHMPEQHARHQQLTPGRLMKWPQAIGPEVLKGKGTDEVLTN
jgi:hypothetical protein